MAEFEPDPSTYRAAHIIFGAITMLGVVTAVLLGAYTSAVAISLVGVFAQLYLRRVV